MLTINYHQISSVSGDEELVHLQNSARQNSNSLLHSSDQAQPDWEPYVEQSAGLFNIYKNLKDLSAFTDIMKKLLILENGGYS